MTAPAKAEVQPKSVPTTPRRWRRWAGSLLFCAALLGIGVWFLPDLVARTALRQEVPKLLFPFFRGTVELGETSLGWMSPIVVKEVKVADASGAPLMTIGEIRSSLTLWQLATDTSSLGRFDLRELAARVVSDPTGTNFDQVIADFLAAPSSGSSKPFELVCMGARVLLSPRADSEAASLPPIDAHLRIGMTKPGEVSLELTAHDEDQPASTLKFQASAQLNTAEPFRLHVDADRWQLAQLTPIWKLWRDRGQVWGELSGKAVLSMAPGSPRRWSCDSDLRLAHLELLDWPELQGDDIRVQDLTVAGRTAVVDQIVECNDLRVDSELAKVQASGSWTMPRWPIAADSLAERRNQEQLLALVDEDFLLTGWLDAAALAQQLPRLLQLRPETKLTEGRLQWRLGSENADGRRVWIGTANLERLAAVVDNTEWSWERPLAAEMRLVSTELGIECERLKVDSDVLQAEGRGNLGAATLRARANLDELSEHLTAILDEQQPRISGELTLDATISRNDREQVHLDAKALVDHLHLGPQNAPLLAEPSLAATMSVIGSGPTETPWSRLETAKLQLTAERDRLEVELREPAAWTGSESPLPLRGTLQGNLTRWARRLQPVLGSQLLGLQGEGTAEVTADWSPEQTVIHQATVDARPLKWSTADWQLDAERLQLRTRGTWNATSAEWTTPETVVDGSFGRVVWKDGRYAAQAPGPLPLAGDVEFDLDVGKISQWRTGAVETHVLGKTQGVARLQPTAEAFTFSVDSQWQNLMYVGLEAIGPAPVPGAPIPAKWVTRWKEPQVQIQTQGRYYPDGQWTLRNARISSDGLTVNANLQIQPDPAGAVQFDTRGQLDYDWGRISQRLDPEWTQKVSLTGAGSKPFAVQGRWQTASLDPTRPQQAVAGNELRGQASLGWQSARVLGLTIGPADLTGSFTGNSGSLQPLDLQVAEGRVRLAPQFRFSPGPMLVQLPAGQVIDRVRLSPELCRDSLKYLTPMLADATEIDGRFSLDLTEAAWPLDNISAGSAAGRLQVHGAQLRPGGLTTSLMSTVEQVRAIVQRRNPRAELAQRLILEMPEQVVQFRQANQRVSHDRLILRSPDVEIRTSGSVGFDESLDLVAAIPIREDWISDERIRQTLGGQTLQIPIRGTLSRPQVDANVLGDLARRVATGAVERVINDRLQNQLNRLLPGINQPTPPKQP